MRPEGIREKRGPSSSAPPPLPAPPPPAKKVAQGQARAQVGTRARWWGRSSPTPGPADGSPAVGLTAVRLLDQQGAGRGCRTGPDSRGFRPSQAPEPWAEQGRQMSIPGPLRRS